VPDYFQTIPRELEDAARIDGCSRIGAMGASQHATILDGTTVR
jgi:hypothetical protein